MSSHCGLGKISAPPPSAVAWDGRPGCPTRGPQTGSTHKCIVHPALHSARPTLRRCCRSPRVFSQITFCRSRQSHIQPPSSDGNSCCPATAADPPGLAR
eukprot:5614531-Amphidinium_carterae.1